MQGLYPAAGLLELRAQGGEQRRAGAERALGNSFSEKEQDHPVCDSSQELSGMCDPEITLAGALAPKD